MNPVEVVISLYDGQVTDYPFDKHAAFLELYFNPLTPEKKPAEASANKSPATPPTSADAEKAPPAAAATPASNEEGTQAKSEPKKEPDNEASDDETVPISVDLYGSIPGLKIEAAKAKDSDADYVGIDMKIARSSTVVFFSFFIMFLMWGVTIGVMLLVSSVLLRGRKIEVGMFSFLAALLFALIAVRNSQPGVPPIGTYSDFISFFWAEVILALCLLTLVFTWLLRPGAK
jgi:fumarate reductase subunit C